MARKPEPVDPDEVKDAVLRMLVERFDGRPLSWEDATMDLALAAFEIKQMALFAPPGKHAAFCSKQTKYSLHIICNCTKSVVSFMRKRGVLLTDHGPRAHHQSS